jgi:hypothetical protein
LLDHRALQLVFVRHVVNEAGHQVEDASLVGVVARPYPVVRDVAVIEGMLPVGELPGHRGAQDQFGRTDLDRVAEAPDGYAVL